MTKYVYAERVTKKVRSLLKYNKNVSDFINETPQVHLDANFCLSSLVWNYYDRGLLVTNNYIQYKEPGLNSAIIIAYNSFDNLLELK